MSEVALTIEHVGSTSVPGLAAKPVIDVCIVAASRGEIHQIIERLAEIGYVHRGHLGIEDREAFARPDGSPRHHLYASPQDSLSLKNHLGLRDYLRGHPEVAREYGRLKIRLAEQFPEDIDSYIEGKTEFILSVLREIGLSEDELLVIERLNRMDNIVRPN